MAWLTVAIFLGCGAGGCGITYPSGRTDRIHHAVHAGDLAAVESELDQGADINVTDGSGRTPLYWAVMLDRLQIASVLIERGADINKGASWKAYATPLHLAASKGYDDMVTLLLDHGAAVDAHSGNGITPLHEAAWQIHPSTVQLLIAKGADVNARDYRRCTALHTEYPFPIPKDWPVADYALVVQILIDHGADVNATNARGETPLKVAREIGDDAAVKELVAAGAKE